MRDTDLNFQYTEDIGLDDNEFAQLIQLFIETSKVDLQEAKKAASAGNSQKVYERMHSIKGAAECLGLYEMSKLVRRTEIMARNKSPKGIEKILDSISKKLFLLSDSLESK